MSRAELSECKDCGAAVLDRSRHRAWHRKLDAGPSVRPLHLSADDGAPESTQDPPA